MKLNRTWIKFENCRTMFQRRWMKKRKTKSALGRHFFLNHKFKKDVPVLTSQVGLSHPGRHLHLNRPNSDGMQSPPFLQGFDAEQMSWTSSHSGPAKPELKIESFFFFLQIFISNKFKTFDLKLCDEKWLN